MWPKPLPEFELLTEFFSYCSESGVIATKKRLANRVPAGRVVGSLSSEGYLKVSFKGGSYAAHRLAWKLFHGYDPEIIDHIDSDKQNNKVENLRSVSYSFNNMFRKTTKGYSQLPNGTYRVVHQGKDVGYYKTAEEAGAAYREARDRHCNL